MTPGTQFNTTWLFPRKTAAFLNLWYRTYPEAREALERYPARFLFPYRSEYVVCEGSMLEHLGIDTNDPDWHSIGHDWCEPNDLAAHERLSQLLKSKLKEPERVAPKHRLSSSC